MNAIGGQARSQVLPPHVAAGDDDRAIALGERALRFAPAVLTHHHQRVELAAAPGEVVRQAAGAEGARAGDDSWKRGRLVAADAGTEVAVHHLDEGPFGDEPRIDRQRAHVVGEADVGREATHSRDRLVEPLVANARAPQSGGRDELRSRLRRRIVVEHADLVPAGEQRRDDGGEIGFNAAGPGERFVREEDAHQAGRSRTQMPSMAQGSPTPGSASTTSRWQSISASRSARVTPRVGQRAGWNSTNSASAAPRAAIVRRAPRSAASSAPSTSILMTSGASLNSSQNASTVTAGTRCVPAVAFVTMRLSPCVPAPTNDTWPARSVTASGRTVTRDPTPFSRR